MAQEKTCVHVSDPLQTDGAAVQKKNTQLYFSSAQAQASCVCSTWKETIAIGSSPPLLTPFLLFFNFLFSLEETFQLWCTPQPLTCCLYITCVCEWIVFHSRAKNRKKISFVCHSSISIKITARRSSYVKHEITYTLVAFNSPPFIFGRSRNTPAYTVKTANNDFDQD